MTIHIPFQPSQSQEREYLASKKRAEHFYQALEHKEKLREIKE